MVKGSPIWDFFYSNKSKYRDNNSYKAAWCRGCLQQRASQLEATHQAAIANGDLSPDTEPYNKEHWLNQAIHPDRAIKGHPKQMTKHIFEECEAVTDAEKEAMKVKLETHGEPRQRPKRQKENVPPVFVLGGPAQSAPGFQGAFSEAQNSMAMIDPTLVNFPAVLQPTLPNMATLPNVDAPESSTQAAKRLRTGYTTSSITATVSHTNPSLPNAPPFNSETQARFSRDLCRLVVACNLSFNLVSHPEFIHFIKTWVPQAEIPDRRDLSGSILEKEVEQVVEKNKSRMGRNYATYQADGWKNIAKDPIVTSMLIVKYKPYLLRTHVMRGRPKTGDEFFELFKSDLEYSRRFYDVEMVAVVTDDGPDGKKMRRLVRESPDLNLATFVCWGHQSSLMTGNYFGAKLPFMGAANKSLEVIKWFNNHGKALDRFVGHQKQQRGKAVALLMGAPTRWTYEYISTARMLRLQGDLISCAATSRDHLLVAGGKDSASVAKASDVIETCLDQDFWKNLRRICGHIEPLAIAANIFQAPTCRLDHVLLTLGNLFHFYENLPPEDTEVTFTMHASLEKRWKNNADQELFILAVFFNPFVRARYFNHSNLSKMAIFHITRRAYERFFGQSTHEDPGFFSSFDHYYDNINDFSDEALNLSIFQSQYHHTIAGQKSQAQDSIDVVRIWKWLEEGASTSGRGALVKLAILILSMVPNSASTERTFSIYDCIHTKRRNRLAPNKVHDAYLIQCDRNDYHAEHSKVMKGGRKRRQFEIDDAAGPSSPTVHENGSDLDLEDTNNTDSEAEHESTLLSLIDHAQEIDSYAEHDDTTSAGEELPDNNQHLEISSSSSPSAPYSKISLGELFDYSMLEDDEADTSGLRFHWSMGRARVDAEEEELENSLH